MANLKFTITTRQFLTFVTPETIYEHFVVQQDHALEKGKISRPIPKRKLRLFAAEAHQSLKRELRACKTPRDVMVLNRALQKQVAPNRLGFIQAAWRGTRRDTLAELNK